MGKDTKTTIKPIKGPIYKGSYGYIKRKKKAYILKTLLYLCIGVAIFMVGLCLNKFQSNNIFTVLAILMVLPGAKALVALAVFWPFTSVSYDRVHDIYERLKEVYPDIAEEKAVMSYPDAMEGQLNVYFDMVYTSSEKVMNLDVLIITATRMLGLQGSKKQKLSYLETHLRDSMEKRGISFGVKIYDKEDSFKKALKELKHENSEASIHNNKDRNEVIQFIETIIVK